MTTTLAEAVSAAGSIAASAGMDPAAATAEARQLSAAVAESSSSVYTQWCTALGLEPSAETFFAAALRGRQFRTAPTALLNRLGWTKPALAKQYATVLAEVCMATAQLVPSNPQVTAAANSAAAAQLSAVTPGNQSVDPMTDFVARGPQVLDEVLARLNAQSARVAELQGPTLDLTGLDPHTAGAFDLTGRQSPAMTPTSPGMVPANTPPLAENVPTADVGSPQAAAAEPTEQAEEETPPEPEKTVDELLAELDELVGLAGVKQEIHRQAAILRVDALREKAGLRRPTITRHLIFVGNPGTGKTTVARLVAGIYKALGLLSKGQLVEVDRSELVAGYLGQTAMKTAEVAEKAKGGVLFIDEAYSLNGDQYGEEAINTLVKEMEDNRDDLVVIVAGYPDPMEEFIAQNPGLASRFRTTITFDDYSDEEVEDIFVRMATAADYDVSDATRQEFRRLLAGEVRDESFGNGRFARNIMEAAVGRHAWRLRDLEEPSLEDLRELRPADLSEDSGPAPTVAWPAPEGEDQTADDDQTAVDDATSESQSESVDDTDGASPESSETDEDAQS